MSDLPNVTDAFFIDGDTIRGCGWEYPVALFRDDPTALVAFVNLVYQKGHNDGFRVGGQQVLDAWDRANAKIGGVA